jgi:UDP-N-acetylmuramoyl-L-alanyl-D-glutamate--2,6-diaminopimelate ligase
VSVVNLDDEYGRRLGAELPEARTFALERPALYTAADLRCDLAGCTFTLRTPAGERRLTLPMPGRFNVANALAAIAAAHSLGGDLDVLVDALAAGVHVPGRFEPVEGGQDFAVLVDYAHTPDSLQNVLLAARELAGSGIRAKRASTGSADAGDAADGRVVCVFGAGGDRDRGKRPMMGEIAARLADIVLVTSDNPRSEDPDSIIEEIMGGARAAANGSAAGGRRLRALSDRREAIATAIAEARSGDVVVIAGKGHEQGQELADGVKVPFDDATVARDALAARGAGERR